MKKTIASILKALLLTILGGVVLLAVYGAYVFLSYYRIPDCQALEPQGNRTEVLHAGETYSAVTYNIGFGAYSQDFSFFMDDGITKDGVVRFGHYGKAIDKEHVERDIEGVVTTLGSVNPDFMLLQEVDTDSTRSYHINEKDWLSKAFADYSSVYAVNFHSPWLNLPLYDPHGTTSSGILTLSSKAVSSAERRSYPLTESLSKVTDLDRCFVTLRYPVSNGKELVLINHHMSAYDKGGVIRAKQLELMSSVLEEEYAKGNYVILGGDFNHVLGEEFDDIYESEEAKPDWVANLHEEDLPQHFSIVKPENGFEIGSCRNSDMTYKRGLSYICLIDGFIVSDNIKASSLVIDSDFQYSDHNPVKLSFTLL